MNNSIDLAIGLNQSDSYQLSLIQQLGLPYYLMHSFERSFDAGLRVFVLTDLEPIRKLTTTNKIVVLTCHQALAKFHGLEMSKRDCRYFHYNSSDRDASFYISLPAYTFNFSAIQAPLVNGSCFTEHNEALPHSGVLSYDHNDIHIISLPWNIWDHKLGQKWAYRPFYAASAAKTFVEFGPAFDTGAIRRLCLEYFLTAYKCLQLPLIRNRPRPAQPTLLVRVDADDYSSWHVDKTLALAQNNAVKFSWYIDLYNFEKKFGLDKLIALQAAQQDINVHSYRHESYRAQLPNLLNFSHALSILQKYDIDSPGIACPFGMLFPAYLTIIRRLGFKYSSEFAFCVDDYPIYPFNDQSYPLQLPTHPGAITTLQSCGFSNQECYQHVTHQLQKNLSDNGFHILYDHPIGGFAEHEEFYRHLLQQCQQENIHICTMQAFYEQWHQRDLNFSAKLHNQYLSVVSGETDNSVFEIANAHNIINENAFATLPPLQINDHFIYQSNEVNRLVNEKETYYATQYSKFINKSSLRYIVEFALGKIRHKFKRTTE